MKSIEIEKQLYLKDIVDLLPLEFNKDFMYKKEENGIRCIGPFLMKGRYTTLSEVKDFQEVFDFDVFASNEKLDGEEFKVEFINYDYTLAKDEVTLIFMFHVYGIKGDEELNEDVIEENEESLDEEVENELDLSMMEELFENKDNVATTYSFVVVKDKDTYESIAERYHVDINDLKEMNQNKDLISQSLLVLPIENK